MSLDGAPECLSYSGPTLAIVIGHRTVDKVRADTSICTLHTAGYRSNKAIIAAADAVVLEARKAAARKEVFGDDDAP